MSKQCLRQPRHTASGRSDRSDRECGAVRSIDNTSIDHTSLRSATRSRPLARLDRLLRRWLPGYNYLRGPIAPIDGSSSSHSSQSRPSADILGACSTSRLQQEQDTRNSVTVEVTASSLPMQKRKDGEVLLDAGIAKSEFCMKLEKLLRAKLIVKE